MSKKKIPKSFKLFATTYNVVMSDMDGVDKLSNDVMIDTFYHEKTHAVLNSMTEYDLSKNEKFVDLFSKLWRQADETAEY